MTLEEIKGLVKNKVMTLEQQKTTAYQSGDIASYDKLAVEIAETAKTLNELESL